MGGSPGATRVGDSTLRVSESGACGVRAKAPELSALETVVRLSNVNNCNDICGSMILEFAAARQSTVECQFSRIEVRRVAAFSTAGESSSNDRDDAAPCSRKGE